MPVVSMFYGIIIKMEYNDHLPPHIHAKYSGKEAMFLLNGELHKGEFPAKQSALVKSWCLLHQEELEANYELTKEKKEVYKIEPLR